MLSPSSTWTLFTNDKIPTNINLGEPKKKKGYKNIEGQEEELVNTEDEEVGRVSISLCVENAGRATLKKLFIYFNWRLITLQYCGGFCHTLTWISHGCTCVPHPEPPSSSHPSGLSQFISLKCPVSCIELGLVIYFIYGNIHISMLFLKSSHPHLLPQSPKVCSLYLCLCCCLAYRVIITIFLNSVYMC